MLAVPDVGDVVGLRDRPIMEVLYSTAMRRGELAGLDTSDVDFERQTVMVRLGKGRKDRVVPIGRLALRWIQRYLDHGRPELLVPPDHGALFLSTVGTAIDPDTLTRTVSRHVQAAKLGHAQPSTTAIYARVTIKRLREIHARTHPAAGNEPSEQVKPEQGHAEHDPLDLESDADGDGDGAR